VLFRSRAVNPKLANEKRRQWALKNPDKAKEIYRRWFRKHGRAHELRRNYGISMADYTAMIERQKGLCAMCGRAPSSRGLMVDHCHATGTLRELLCNSCNVIIGHAKDDPERLLMAVRYLLKHSHSANQQEGQRPTGLLQNGHSHELNM